MGTRSLTIFQDSAEICVMYRQFDGYPEGHGRELATFLSGITITNGRVDGHTANGLQCLSAQIVAHFKTEPGEFYLMPAGTRDAGEEYRYTVYGVAPMEPHVRAEAVVSWGTVLRGETVDLLFDGPASELLAWINENWPESADAEPAE